MALTIAVPNDVWSNLSNDAKLSMLFIGIALCTLLSFLLIIGSALLAYTTIRERKNRKMRFQHLSAEAQQMQDSLRPEIIMVNIAADYTTVAPSTTNLGGGGNGGGRGFNIKEVRAVGATDSKDSREQRSSDTRNGSTDTRKGASAGVRALGAHPPPPRTVIPTKYELGLQGGAVGKGVGGANNKPGVAPGVYSASLYPKK